MTTITLANYFQLFTKENCDLETYKALGLRVGFALSEVFNLNDNLQEFNIFPVEKEGALSWLNPSLKVGNEAPLSLDNPQWDLTVKSWNVYKDLEKEDKQKMIDNIQNVIDLAMSFFPTYKPLSKSASFTLNKKGFILDLGVEGQVVGSYKI